MLAYLVIREGPNWTDVVRLVEGRTVTIGRAPTNQIVIKDERCSRYHAEVFSSDGKWTLRDLDSRNGTELGGQRIRGDHQLTPGDVFRVAHAQLAFVHDLATAFPDPASTPSRDRFVTDETAVGPRSDNGDDSDVLATYEPTMITHRRGETRFLKAEQEEDESTAPQVGRAAAKLCRLAFELAKEPDVNKVAKLALDGLFEGTQIDAGAVLLLPRGFRGNAVGSDLEVVASRTENSHSYHRLSPFLATTVLRDGEAVLARNVADDSTLGSRDSHGEIHATSVICAPIRQADRVIGIIHSYSTNEKLCPNPDDLEFTLAVADNVALAIKNLGRQQELVENLSQTQDEILQLRVQLGAESELIGSSAAMQRVKQQIVQAAPSRATVLIRGESGVGKELVARAVHFSSPRKKGPFVCLNCAALSETLLESELFGHERGAFTGATERKIGKFEAADQGTLMLDEIGEMSESIQAKFLRVLEGHPFERVGGSQAIKVDVRVIAATNRDLEKAVAEGDFRRDLYFRLNVVEILVPPLRKRADDVEVLANHFLARFNAETGKRIRGFTPTAREQLLNYRWPGNIRELKNVIERAVVLARSNQIDLDDLNLSKLATAGDTGDLGQIVDVYQPLTLAEAEKKHIERTLAANDWNKSRTAGILGIERSTLDRKIRRYHIKPDPTRSA
ncbi:MAG: sigma 54-interacting transcriptional regulator [Pirellulaceae bacterium]|nr:sigma 54-interacting transcriptional regulator [Planctomycetales bacterium]